MYLKFIICFGFLGVLVETISHVKVKTDSIITQIKGLEEEHCMPPKNIVPEIPEIFFEPDERSKTFCNRLVGVSNSFFCQIIKNNHMDYTEDHESPSPRSCREIKDKGETESGIYKIKPRISPEPIMVYCDMETNDGGWTVIHRRMDGSEDFQKKWTDYRFGFGDLWGEFWLGNQNIYHLTNPRPMELLIELTDQEHKFYAHYKEFRLGTTEKGFPLNLIRGYSGDAGDALNIHKGCKFSAWDLDLDECPQRNCAEDHMGAWWFNGTDDTPCLESNLNGKYSLIPLITEDPDTHRCVYWLSPESKEPQCFSGSRMLVRAQVERKKKKDLPNDDST